MPLDIKVQKALLAHVNLGNEGQGDGMISRLDLKFTFNTTSDVLRSLLNIKKSEKDIYWRGGNIIEGMGEQVITSEWNHNDLLFDVHDSLFKEDNEYRVSASNCRVKNVKVTPMQSHLLDVSMTVQIREPDEHQMHLIAAYQKKEGGLIIKFDDSVVEPEEDKAQQEL